MQKALRSAHLAAALQDLGSDDAPPPPPPAVKSRERPALAASLRHDPGFLNYVVARWTGFRGRKGVCPPQSRRASDSTVRLSTARAQLSSQQQCRALMSWVAELALINSRGATRIGAHAHIRCCEQITSQYVQDRTGRYVP